MIGRRLPRGYLQCPRSGDRLAHADPNADTNRRGGLVVFAVARNFLGRRWFTWGGDRPRLASQNGVVWTHFASWCVTGEPSSSQIENGTVGAALGTTTVLAPAVGVELVGSFGSAAVRSGPNVMAGLSAIGGSAVGGIAVLGGGSGLIATGVMCRALADKPTLPTDQREARRAGRQAALGRAVVGTGAAVYAVGAIGVPGFSGAGISSGLAALGSLSGGGMVRGLSTTVLIPHCSRSCSDT